MDKKQRILIIGQYGYYSLIAEGYLRFYAGKKLKIKTTAFDNFKVSNKVAKILEEDIIQSKENIQPLEKMRLETFDHLLLVGTPASSFSEGKFKGDLHIIKIKKNLSLKEERDLIKKKVLKFLGQQGMYLD